MAHSEMPVNAGTIEAYDYNLPQTLIAQHPLKDPGDNRMMVVDRNGPRLVHTKVAALKDYLCADDCIVVNNTKVVNAWLIGSFRGGGGGNWSGLYLGVVDNHWKMLFERHAEVRSGQTLVLCNKEDHFELTLIEQDADGAWSAVPEHRGNPVEVLSRFGRLPLPPYIRDGIAEQDDILRYQTCYASCYGAIAAPSAGLHLSRRMLDELSTMGIPIFQVTLHIGLGTYRLIYCREVSDHRMHSEWMEVGHEAAYQISESKRRGKVLAIGTTSLRALETASLEGTIRPFTGYTDLFVRPGFRFRTTDALLTNFHLPRTSLLVLVKAFAGNDIVNLAYKEAIAQRYRFCDYGDAMLIL